MLDSRTYYDEADRSSIPGLLRSIGYFLDSERLELESLHVLSGGIALTTSSTSSRGHADYKFFNTVDLSSLGKSSLQARGAGEEYMVRDTLFPTGYQDFLRALGRVILQEHWSSIRLVYVGALLVIRVYAGSERQLYYYDRRDVRTLLDYSFGLRNAQKDTLFTQDMCPLPTATLSSLPPIDFDTPLRGPLTAKDGRKHHAVDLTLVEDAIQAVKGFDLFISEIDGGYLASFMNTFKEQEIITFDRSPNDYLQHPNQNLKLAECSARQSIPHYAIVASPDAQDTVARRTPLSILGQFLDTQSAYTVFAQHIDNGTWLTDYVLENPNLYQERPLSRLRRIVISEAVLPITAPKKRFLFF